MVTNNLSKNKTNIHNYGRAQKETRPAIGRKNDSK